MTFGVVLTIILIVYALYYLGLVIYDMYFAKPTVVKSLTLEEDEIDISDIANSDEFAKKKKNKKKLTPERKPIIEKDIISHNDMLTFEEFEESMTNGRYNDFDNLVDEYENIA